MNEWNGEHGLLRDLALAVSIAALLFVVCARLRSLGDRIDALESKQAITTQEPPTGGTLDTLP